MSAPATTWTRDLVHRRPVRLAASPALWGVDDFLDQAEIAAVLGRFGDEAFVTAHADYHGWDDSGFVAEVEADCDPSLQAVSRRIEAAVGRTSRLTPTLRFRHSLEGDFHRPHVDAYEVGEHRLAISALVAALAADEGGETRFVAAEPAPIAVEPRVGRLIAWTSTLRDGAADQTSRDDGAPVLRGSKAVLLAFFYLPLAELDGDLHLS